MVRKSRSNAGPEAAIIFAISPLLIMPGMGWCIPCMPLAVGAGTCCPHALSQALMRLISGPWPALIFAARPLTFWECAREAASSAIATAWRWWTLICRANVTSAALCAPGTTETEADSDPDTGTPSGVVAELTPPAAKTTTATATPADQVSAVFRAVQRMEEHISTSRGACLNTEYGRLTYADRSNVSPVRPGFTAGADAWHRAPTCLGLQQVPSEPELWQEAGPSTAVYEHGYDALLEGPSTSGGPWGHTRIVRSSRTSRSPQYSGPALV